MRQISTSPRRGDLRLDTTASTRLGDRAPPRPRQPPPSARTRDPAGAADRAQRPRPPRPAATRPLTPPPATRPALSDAQLLRARRGRRLQHDLRPPPQAPAVALGLMRDHAADLQVVEPTLHRPPMRRHKPATLQRVHGRGAPAHHRRQPDDQLLDRAREPPRARCVPEPEQIPLQRIHPRLQTIVTRRRAPPRTPCPSQQRVDDQAARLGRQRLDRGPVPRPAPTSAIRRGYAIQRHRQRPTAPRQQTAPRPRADARGAAGETPSDRARHASGARRTGPSARGCRSVRRTARVRVTCICGRSSRSAEWPEGRSGRPGGHPVFLVLRHAYQAGRGTASGDRAPRTARASGHERRAVRRSAPRTELLVPCLFPWLIEPGYGLRAGTPTGPVCRHDVRWAVAGSNRRPPACKAGALTN